MTVSGLNHINIQTSDLDRAKEFYCGLLGLEEGYRPPFDNPGAWLYAGDAPIVHMGITADQTKLPASAIDHYAFTVNGLDEVFKMLKEKKIDFRSFQVPDNPARQIFVEDPDGVMVELNFPDGT